MSQVFGYTRYSIERSRDGTSELDQRERIKNYHSQELSHLPLHDLDRCADRAVSAYRYRFIKRPAGKYIDETIQRGDFLVIPYFDRGWRKVWDALWTIEKYLARGISIRILDYLGADIETFEGLATLTLAALMSEGHSKRLSARMKSVALTRKKYDLNADTPLSRTLVGFKNVRIRNKDLGIDAIQIQFDPEQLPLLKKYYDAKMTGLSDEKLQQKLTDEKRRELGLKIIPFAFIDNPKEKVSIKTIERGACVYELVQPYLAAGAYVPYHEIRDRVQDLTEPDMRPRMERYKQAKKAMSED